MWLLEGEALVCTCFTGFKPLRRTRPRLGRRERHLVPRAMDYQQKLAEKLTILNERGNGVLIRMNYIKKVRGKRGRVKRQMVWSTKMRNKELLVYLIYFGVNTSYQTIKMYLRANTWEHTDSVLSGKLDLKLLWIIFFSVSWQALQSSDRFTVQITSL